MLEKLRKIDPYLRKTEKLTDVMDRYRGIGPGFDLLRLGLAVLIFYAHTKFAVSLGSGAAMFGGTNVMPNTTALTADNFSTPSFFLT